MKEDILNQNNLIKTSDIAKQLHTTKNVILACSRRCGIKKDIQHGKTTYWTKNEITKIIDEFKHGKKSNNRGVAFHSTVDITIKELNKQKEMANKSIKKYNQITTSQLAKQLKTTNDVIIACSKRCGIKKDINNGVVTYWNEIEVSKIINEFKSGNKSNNRSFELTQSLTNTTTNKLDKHNAVLGIHNITKLVIEDQLKACLYLNNSLLKALKNKNDQLLQENKRLEIKQKATTLQAQRVVGLKQKWAIIDKYIKQIADTRARGIATANDYLSTYTYYYNEFFKMHRYIDRSTINKKLFMSNAKYMNELLEIIIADKRDYELK